MVLRLGNGFEHTPQMYFPFFRFLLFRAVVAIFFFQFQFQCFFLYVVVCVSANKSGGRKKNDSDNSLNLPARFGFEGPEIEPLEGLMLWTNEPQLALWTDELQLPRKIKLSMRGHCFKGKRTNKPLSCEPKSSHSGLVPSKNWFKKRSYSQPTAQSWTVVAKRKRESNNKPCSLCQFWSREFRVFTTRAWTIRNFRTWTFRCTKDISDDQALWASIRLIVNLWQVGTSDVPALAWSRKPGQAKPK